MSRENFNKSWKLDIPFDITNITPSSSFSDSLFVINHNDKIVDELRINEGVNLFGSDGFFGIQINIPTDHYPEGTLSWEINVILNGLNILSDQGMITMIGKPIKEKVARPWDLLNPKTKYVKKDIGEKRLDTCKSCEHYNKQFCNQCGCFMPIKTKMEHSSCPIGKW